MRSIIVCICMCFALGGESVAGEGPSHLAGEAIPAYASVYTSSARDLSVGSWPAAAARVESPAMRALPRDASASSAGAKRFLPVIYSLILPGAGEISLGYYWRGAALVAAEATAWTGYAVYHDRGLDGRERFEAFADAHWDHRRWLVDHNVTAALALDTSNMTSEEIFQQIDEYGRTGQWSSFPGWHSYAAKEDEKQNYYENIGKYDWFISGWEDWAATGKGENTPLRDQYRALRKESNDDLDTADRFIYLSIAARVFSLVQTVFLVQRDNRSEPETGGQRSYRLTARSTGVGSGEVAFEYRFR